MTTANQPKRQPAQAQTLMDAVDDTLQPGKIVMSLPLEGKQARL